MHCSKAATLEILCKSWLRLQPAACLSSNMSDLSDIVNTSSWCHGHSLLEYHLNQNLHLWWFNSWLVTFLGWWVQGWPEHSRGLLVRDLLADPGIKSSHHFFFGLTWDPSCLSNPYEVTLGAPVAFASGKGSPNSAPASGPEDVIFGPLVDLPEVRVVLVAPEKNRSIRDKKTSPPTSRKLHLDDCN